MYSSSSGINTLNAEYEIIEYAMITYLLFDKIPMPCVTWSCWTRFTEQRSFVFVKQCTTFKNVYGDRM
jgi:hypothetical protein